MIYYPMSILMLAGRQDILIISIHQDLPNFKNLLGDGSKWGLSLSCLAQPHPEGLAQAFTIGREFIDNDNTCLILRDNTFYSHGLPEYIKPAFQKTRGAAIFCYWAKDPQRYDVVDCDQHGSVINIEEKPEKPRSNLAVTGLYFYDNRILDIVVDFKQSFQTWPTVFYGAKFPIIV